MGSNAEQQFGNKKPLIGTGPNQVSTNAMLGSAAFTNTNPMYYVEAYLPSVQTIDSTGETVGLVKYRDNHNLFNDTNHNYTCPASGLYFIYYHAEIYNISNSSQNWVFPGNIYIDGSATYTSDDTYFYVPDATTYQNYNVFRPLYLAQGQTISIWARYGNVSSTFDLTGNANPANTRLQIWYLGRDDVGV